MRWWNLRSHKPALVLHPMPTMLLLHLVPTVLLLHLAATMKLLHHMSTVVLLHLIPAMLLATLMLLHLVATMMLLHHVSTVVLLHLVPAMLLYLVATVVLLHLVATLECILMSPLPSTTHFSVVVKLSHRRWRHEVHMRWLLVMRQRISVVALPALKELHVRVFIFLIPGSHVRHGWTAMVGRKPHVVVIAGLTVKVASL